MPKKQMIGQLMICSERNCVNEKCTHSGEHLKMVTCKNHICNDNHIECVPHRKPKQEKSCRDCFYDGVKMMCDNCKNKDCWKPHEKQGIEVEITNLNGLRYEISYAIPLGLIMPKETKKFRLVEIE